MGIGNGFIKALLQSPFHRMFDRSFDLVRYRGRRSNELFSTPTQYAAHDDGIVIFVGRPETKTWWRNFRGGRDLEVLLHGQWVPMVGRAVVGSSDPDTIAPLLASYLHRHPRLARHLPNGATEPPAAVVVWCRPRRPAVADVAGEGGIERSLPSG
ncbi:MAG: hypothetical protein JWL70_1335 [Acidimicrobiia bacterium]|nr:hypothetical protein [Acidimicrobiia bacterium]